MPRQGRVRVQEHTRSYPRSRSNNDGWPMPVLLLALFTGVTYVVAQSLQ
jgi:hypothetical protein